MSIINEDYLDKINAQLDGLIDYMDTCSKSIEKDIEGAGNKGQEVANEKMEQLSENLNSKLNVIRDKVVEVFSSQYQKAMEKIAPIEPLLNVSLSLDTVVSVVQSVIEVITAPYQPIIQFTTEVIPKVIEISSKIQQVASYQPSINVPNVDVPPLSVNVEPITPSDIID